MTVTEAQSNRENNSSTSPRHSTAPSLELGNEHLRRRIFGIDFHCVTMQQAVDQLFIWITKGRREHTRFVVTPNVNLTLRYQNDAGFRHIIKHADLVVVDGAPLVWASRLVRKPLPERVAGSDLVYELFNLTEGEVPLRVFLLGAMPGVADRAAVNIEQRWPNVRVVGTHSPPMGFENNAALNDDIVAQVNAAAADVLIVGLGAPKQEVWTYRYRERLDVPVTLCVGATIDFLAGEQRRAPNWIRRAGFEWVYRMTTGPRRLIRRYAGDIMNLPGLLWREMTGRLDHCFDDDACDMSLGP